MIAVALLAVVLIGAGRWVQSEGLVTLGKIPEMPPPSMGQAWDDCMTAAGDQTDFNSIPMFPYYKSVGRELAPGIFHFDAWVDATNGQGTRNRLAFTCTVGIRDDPRAGWYTIYFNLADEIVIGTPYR